MFQVFEGISSQIGKEIFQFRDPVPYQLKNRLIFKSHLHVVLSAAQKV